MTVLKKILIIVLWFCYLSVSGQSVECGFTPTKEYLEKWDDPNSMQNKSLEFIMSKPLSEVYEWTKLDYTNEVFSTPPIRQTDSKSSKEKIIPIVAHIIRKSDRSGGLNLDSLKSAIDVLNNAYLPHRMKFILCGTNYIDSDTIFSRYFDEDFEDITYLEPQKRNKARKLNIYFVPSAETSWAYSPHTNKRIQHILILNEHVTNKSTLIHEIGHWFDLIHTHGPINDVRTRELAKRIKTNCESEGDELCDTAADPQLNGKVDESFCKYNKSEKDKDGIIFKPDATNFMSYAPYSCRKRFSKGQISRILSAYLNMKSWRGYTFDPCSKPIETKPSKPVSLNWGDKLELPKNISSDTPDWAICLWILMEWRDNSNYKLEDIYNVTGYIGNYFDGLPPNIDKIMATSLFTELPTAFTPQSLETMLQYGPLWIASSMPSWGPFTTKDKTIVIVGIDGDGTPGGTQIFYFDPSNKSTPGIVSIPFNEFITEIEAEWAMEIPGAFYMVHP